MLKVRGLSKNFGGFSLTNINLDCSTSDPLVILGPCGSGKTLLLECVAGLHGSVTGEITLDSVDINRLPPEKRNVGFVYQNYNLFPHLSVYENILYGTRYTAMSDKDRVNRFNELIQTLALKDLIDRNDVTKLSGGEQQKVTLARALMVQPSLLLFDEPLSSLDFNLREKLGTFLSTISKKFGIPSVFVTHSHEEAALLGKNILILHRGRSVQFDERKKVYENPVNSFVASYLGMKNIYSSEKLKILTDKMNLSAASADSIDKNNILIPERALHLDCICRCIPDYKQFDIMDFKGSGTLVDIKESSGELKLQIRFNDILLHKTLPLEYSGLIPRITEKTDFIIDLTKIRVLEDDCH
jgi:ABC-type Fe3+/spermidine/putrescine transport system ATPase subunit